MTFVGKSFDEPERTVNITGLGAIRVLEAVRRVKDVKNIRVYQASSSEMYGDTKQFPQNEEVPFSPKSPYAYAKVLAHNASVNYRSAYGIHVSSGILFNHEGEFRGEEFVTRKITKNVAKIKLGKIERFELGLLEPKRDWGYAGDYVEAMWLMLQQEKPDDYVIATGKNYSVKDFINLCARILKINLKWKGKGISTKAYDQRGNCIIRCHKKYFRPAEVDQLLGNALKAKKKLKWKPKTSFKDLVIEMLHEDLKIAENLISEQKR